MQIIVQTVRYLLNQRNLKLTNGLLVHLFVPLSSELGKYARRVTVPDRIMMSWKQYFLKISGKTLISTSLCTTKDKFCHQWSTNLLELLPAQVTTMYKETG